MEFFWSRLIGSSYTPKKPVAPAIANDPQSRLKRFQAVYNNVLDLFNRPRDLSKEGPLLNDANLYLERIVTLLRDETRAPVPHSCIQYAKTTQMYAVIAKAATVSQYEPLIHSSVSIYAALIDSEEEGFLSSIPFAKSLMRLVTKVVDVDNMLVGVETETVILELLFTISAKIRLQPEILPVWFRVNTKFEAEDLVVKEKKTFVGHTGKDDFPLCYLLIDRVHHEGRIGDFSRTGLLYIFEATGRSVDLEQWVIASDLPTLMSTGLGALYSQLSRELSIVHFDANLPAVLAMSDYRTTHPRFTAESAHSERHKAHMATFLSYLAFFQDILDHCRSSEVKSSLLDHFQILFSQQLLYPSLLQSSDTDAGSSVAVLTYVTAMLQSLEYPDLVDSMLTYLLAIPGGSPMAARGEKTPPSPTSVRRRESLLQMNAPRDPDNAVDPNLFSLVDLIVNNLNSTNAQSVYAALQLTSTILTKQKTYAFGTLLKGLSVKSASPERTVGALHVELAQYAELARALHRQLDLEDTYASLCTDIRQILESQDTSHATMPNAEKTVSQKAFLLSVDNPLIKLLLGLLRTFFTNSVEVNLALTQAIISIALCSEIRLENWALLSPQTYRHAEQATPAQSWQSYLHADESSALNALRAAAQPIIWERETSPILYQVLTALSEELQTVRTSIPTIEQLIAGRKIMLQAYNLGGPLTDNPPLLGPSTQLHPSPLHNHTPSSRPQSRASAIGHRGPDVATADPQTVGSTRSGTPAGDSSPAGGARGSTSQAPPAANSGPSVFRPPPPEAPSTTDILMKNISLPPTDPESSDRDAGSGEESAQPDASPEPGVRTASLNHILTNVVILQEFVLEFVAVVQVRAALFGESEVRVL